MGVFLPSGFNGVSDQDAVSYVEAVERADGQLLEFAVGKAINDFVLGCKADGIWDAIKASCILAGARTLNGALIPLKGTAPTNFNFVSGDYNRKTGLVGAANKYLDSNRSNNADPQNSAHISAYSTVSSTGTVIGATTALNSRYLDTAGVGFRLRLNGTAAFDYSVTPPSGLLAGSRNSNTVTLRYNNATQTVTNTSAAPTTDTLFVFARRNTSSLVAESFYTGRLAFYSIGTSLDLALLDTRVTALINTFNSVIP